MKAVAAVPRLAEVRSRQRTLLGDDARQRLFAIPTDEASMARYYLLTEPDRALIARRRRDENRLGFAVQLCLLRHPGGGLRFGEEIPAPFAAFVADQIGVSPASLAAYATREETRREHGAELLAYLDLRVFGRDGVRLAHRAGVAAAWGTDRGEPIVSAIIQSFREARIVIPIAATLERIGLAARARARQTAHAALVTGLTPEQRDQFDTLLVVDPSSRRSELAWLRDYAEAPRPTNILGALDRLDRVRGLGLDRSAARRIHAARMERLVDEGAIMSAQHLSDLEPNRRTAVLAAQAIHLETELADAALTLFERFMGTLFTRARSRGEQRFTATRADVTRTLVLFRRMIMAVHEAKSTGEDGLDVIEREVGLAQLDGALPIIDAVTGIAQEDQLVTATERFMSLRRFAQRFLDAFAFKATRSGDPLLAALALLKMMNAKGQRELPARVPMSFLSAKHRKLIMASGTPDRRLYEMGTFDALRTALRGSNVWVEGSRDFQAFEDYLLPVDATVPEGIKPDLEDHATAYLARRKTELAAKLRRVAADAKRGQLDGVEIEEGRLYIARIRRDGEKEALALSARLYSLVPRVRITELLAEVDRWTGFSGRFAHARTGEPCADKPALLAALLADGTNLGLARMADASRGLAYHHLVNIAEWHVSDDGYANARAAIVDAHHAHPMAAVWGDGTTSSSDGQYFRTGGTGSWAGDVNARHGNEAGAVMYTHVSSGYGPFHTTVFSAAVSEAPYVLDGLMHHYHRTSLRIKEHYTDSAGATDAVFGLSHLLGFRFAPRIKDLAERKFYVFERSDKHAVLDPLVGGLIDTAIIIEQWPALLRLAASIRAGTVAPSIILRKLAAAGKGNRLAAALRQVGRIERTGFMLDWLSDPQLRQRSHAGLNKGEAMNALRRAVFFHRLGEIRDRTFENQGYRASGLSLVTAAIVCWNTVYLGRAVDHLRERDVQITAEQLARIAPLGWEHIALTGDYVWDSNTNGGFRPLRAPRRTFQHSNP